MTENETETLTTEALQVGMTVRRFRNSEAITIAALWPVGTNGVEVTAVDGSRVTTGRGAKWYVA